MPDDGMNDSPVEAQALTVPPVIEDVPVEDSAAAMPEMVPVDGEWHYPLETPAIEPAQIEAPASANPLEGHMPVWHSTAEQSDLYTALIVARDKFLAATDPVEKAQLQKAFDEASAKYNHAAYHRK